MSIRRERSKVSQNRASHGETIDESRNDVLAAPVPTGWRMSSDPVGYALAASLIAASFIHLLPAIGMLSAARLTALYGMAPADPTTLLLLRHRAVMFAVLGLGFGAAAFVPMLRVPAAFLSLVTMLSFVWLAQGHAHGAAIRRVVRVDVVVSVLVGAALIASAVF